MHNTRYDLFDELIPIGKLYGIGVLIDQDDLGHHHQKKQQILR